MNKSADSKADVIREIKALTTELAKFDQAYYNTGSPIVSDVEYDAVKHKLQDLVEKAGARVKDKVGHQVRDGDNKYHHFIPMLSLDNIFDDQGLEGFFHKHAQKTDFIVDSKIDGVAAAIHYIDGELKYMVTRGDGVYGSDITHLAHYINDLPLRLNTKKYKYLEVRGEIYIRRSDFLTMQNSEKVQLNTPRNTVSGTLAMKNFALCKDRHMRFMAYGVGFVDHTYFDALSGYFELFVQLGFHVPIHILTSNIGDIRAFYSAIPEHKKILDCDIDGVVIKVNSLEYQKHIGSTYKSPRWAIAYKQKANEFITKINNVEYNVSRYGCITPIAILEPIDIDGVIVSKVNLHNFDLIATKNIKIGDYASIIRSGDVIPHIKSIVIDNGGDTITYPKECPFCNFRTQMIDAFCYCMNQDCEMRIISEMTHFASIHCFNIKTLARKRIVALYNNHLLRRPIDIFNIHNNADKIIAMGGFGPKIVAQMIEDIELAKNINFDNFIFSLNIKNIGLCTSRDIAKYFQSVEDLISNVDKLDNIHGIGEHILNSFRDFVSYNADYIMDLANIVNISYPNISAKASRLVFTGVLKSYARNNAIKISKDKGFIIDTHLSKNADYVVCGDKAGSKMQKARTMNVTCISEDEWLALIGQK